MSAAHSLTTPESTEKKHQSPACLQIHRLLVHQLPSPPPLHLLTHKRIFMKDFKEIPDEETINAAADLEIYDEKGQKVKFGSIFEEQKTIVVFIRHFICGSCQSYVIELNKVPSEALEAAQTRIVVIGCGEYGPIKAYKEITDFRSEIYADPSRKLYHALGMNIEKLEGAGPGEEKPSYAPPSQFKNTIGSIWRAFQHPTMIGKQGNVAQLGGDFIFGPGNKCTFASRMKHTEDHLEVVDLMKEAGVVYQQS